MKKRLFILTLCLTLIASSQAQIILQENFESGSFPSGWTQKSSATDGGWKIGSSSALSSQFWPISDNGSIGIAATNDDACNCNKSKDRLISPPFDLRGLSGAVLQVDVFFGKGSYQSFSEEAAIEVSLDGVLWSVLEDIHGHGGWDTHHVNLSNFIGEDSVYISFNYNDGGGWLFGLAIDNIIVEVPPALDVALVKLNYRPYGEENTSIEISGTGFNMGLTPITSLEFEYTINGENAGITLLEGLNIQPLEYFDINHPTAWEPSIAGIYEIKVTIISVNGTGDEIQENNSQSFQTEIYPRITPPNRIDEFLLTEPVFTTIATVSDNLNKPTDLDFFPILGKNELWVINERIESSGGSTLTIYDAGTPNQALLHREDGNAWHFMALPMGIAFSDNFNFACSPGIKDSNHSGGTFTGPALWSSDPAIYAQPSGGNGSHLDMLHGSPFSMGIASESDNVFWVFDGWNGTLVRYDFQHDHGPGNDDHANGLVRRYTEIQVKRDGNIPSHLVIDKPTGWLYAVDNGNNRVIRLDIHSGNVVGTLPLINEPLAEHSQMGNVTWEVIADSLDRPCGIEVIGNRLLVGEYTSGEIIVYDIENNFAELGRIGTGQSGLTGIKIGPDGSIWYTNRTHNTLTRLEPGVVSGTAEQSWLADVLVMPNPTTGLLVITLPQMADHTNTKIDITDLAGQRIMAFDHAGGTERINLNALPNGMYILSIFNDSFVMSKKIVLEK
jgi:hypothetical protein